MDTLIIQRENEYDDIIAMSLCSSGTCHNAEVYPFKEKWSISKKPSISDSYECHLRFWTYGEPPQTSLTTNEDLWANRALNRPIESAFNEREEIKSNKIKKLLNDIREQSRIPYADELAGKLHYLIELINEDPDEGSISIDSMKIFISFIQNNNELRCPKISLTPSNEIYAQWREAPNRHFSAEFLSTGETRWVVFKPNSRNPEITDRLSGLTTDDSLMETVLPHNILEWASQ